MKRLIGVLLLAAVVVTMIVVAGAAETEKKIVFTADTAEAKVGDTVTVTLSLEGFENCDTFMFYDPEYNTEALEWTGGSWMINGLMSDYVMDSSVVNRLEQGRSDVLYAEKPIELSDKDVATFEFRVLKETGLEEIGFNVIAKNGDTVLSKNAEVVNAEVRLAQPVELKTFLGTNITMGNALDLNFAFSTSHVDATGYAEIVRTFADDRADEVTRISLADCEVRSGAYVITYNGLAAKEMCDEVTVTVYDADDQQISVKYSDSMRSYIMRNIDKSSTNNEVRTLFVDMLNYGSAAQENFGYAKDDLANNQLTDAQKVYGTQKIPDCENDRVTSGSNTYMGTNFVLENKISMQMAVKAADVSGGSMEIDFTNHYGEKINVTVQAEEATIQGSYAIFEIDEIVVADGRQDITCTFRDAGGNVVETVVDSMESYIARMGGSNQWLYEIMKFSDSAYAYLHN